tara:strand:- start:34063 stop:36141 length:2079 start_codon:yes stop_codon:yes gene_type:complete
VATRFLFIVLFFPALSIAAVVEYEFDISVKEVKLAGEFVEALAIDDQIPAPTVRAAVGDVLRATFHNRLDVATSVHWHGILLPGDQDGVPFLNTQPIMPGSSHTFEFPITHAGTFWYHSHTDLQIQKGLYGAVVLSEADSNDSIDDRVVLFSDWTDEAVGSVLGNLKARDDFYSFKRGTIQSWDKVLQNGTEAIRNRLSSSISRMGTMDLADVGYDAFLVNGQRENSIADFSAGSEQLKLRMINGSTSSYYDVEYAAGPMTIVAADGQDVEPIRVKRLRISTAETYDVLVPLRDGQSYELRASSIDGSGHSSLFVGEGEKVLAPDVPKPNPFLQSHMDMPMSDLSPMMHEHGESLSTQPDSDVMAMQQHADLSMPMQTEVIEHMIDYSALMATHVTTLPEQQQWREIELALTGNMERYVWSFNGKTATESPQILIRKGENVRFLMKNDTMMHHPLHLHGHFFRVVNQHGERSPLKHTVNVPPMASVVIEFDANEKEDWLFHCHNQFHMKTGMNRVVSYEQSSLFTPEIERLIRPSKRWFDINSFHAMSSFLDYEFSVFDERHEFALEIDADFSNSYEVHASYKYYFSRFVSGFAGIESREHHHDNTHDIGIAGLNVTLPLLIDSEWRVDDHGNFRLELQSEIPLTRRFGLDWRWNTDSEYRYGLNYRLNSRWSLSVHTDTEYGNGLGVKFFY